MTAKTLTETIAEAVSAAPGGSAADDPENDPLVTGAGEGDGDEGEGDAGTGTGDGDATADGDTEGDGAEGDGAAGEGDTGTAGATGTAGKPKTLTADEQAAADAAEADATAASVAAKAAERARLQAEDPVNAPIPKELKVETKTRMKKLVNLTKELSTARDSATKDRDELINMMQGTGAPPDEVGQTLHFLKLSHSTDRAQQEQALEYAQGLAANLARRLGKPIPGVDMLAGHEDLRAAMTSGSITRKYAEELAAQREAVKVRTTDTARESEASQQAAVRQKARDDLNALEVELKASDPAGYDAKRAQLTGILQPLFVNMHPSKWAPAFREAYGKLRAVAQPKPRVVPSGGNQPLRARQPAGGSNGQVAEPKNMAEAVAAGLARATK